MITQSVSQTSVQSPLPLENASPECPACECGMRFIRPKGLCLIWVCPTCGHALIRRLEEPKPERRDDRGLLFLDELLG